MSNFIKNIDLPICRQCKHCSRKPYELDVCKRFGKANINTGKITLYKTYSARNNEDMCGKSGKYYSHDKMYVIKNSLAQTQEYLPFFGLVSAVSIYAHYYIDNSK